MACLALAAMTLFAACDDSTETLGSSLTNDVDKFKLIPDTFEVKTRSVAIDQIKAYTYSNDSTSLDCTTKEGILARGLYSYVGHIKDIETDSYVTGNYTTQFNILEAFDEQTLFPEQDSIRSILEEDGGVMADSCTLRIYLNNNVGDSLNPMKITVCEMARPVEEGKQYYTDFDPESANLLRTDADAIRKNKVYTALDLNLSDSLRMLVVDKTNRQSITIPLNTPYVDRNGKRYNNYGTYIMRTYYEHPEYFRNSYNFAHNVCPGFYIKCTDGLGVMSEVYLSELHTYYKYESNDSIYDGLAYFSGTEEVMQTTSFLNDKQRIQELAGDGSCTYLKTPAGIFTEVELPVEEIKAGHENDTVSSAKIVFQRINDLNEDKAFGTPTYILMVPMDSVYSFFESKSLPDSENAYLATYSSTYNTYTFNNISSLITNMYNRKRYLESKGKAVSPNWNKVVLVPVAVTQSTSTYGSTSITDVANEMALKSTRLIGGPDNQRDKITISVIYNKFNNN